MLELFDKLFKGFGGVADGVDHEALVSSKKPIVASGGRWDEAAGANLWLNEAVC